MTIQYELQVLQISPLSFTVWVVCLELRSVVTVGVHLNTPPSLVPCHFFGHVFFIY